MSVQAGQVATMKRTLVQADFDRFAVLSGDDNPIHVDPDFAARTRFGRTVAHGMFLYSLICGVLGTQVPGPGMLQLQQELMFPTATPACEEVEARVEVTTVRPADGVVELSTQIVRPDGTLGLQGRTWALPPGASTRLGPALSGPDGPAYTAHPPDSVPFKAMEPGQKARMRRAFTAADLDEYADLTGDTNPLFTDGVYARRAGFEACIIPGGLLGGLFSYLLGTRLPGEGTNYLKQRLAFPQPAYVGQRLSASVQIARIRPDKQLVNLRTVCTDPARQIVCQGEALVLVSDVLRTS